MKMKSKKPLWFMISLFVILIIFLANITLSTGFFRNIEFHFDGEIVKSLSLYGTEDITISALDSFALISSTKRNIGADVLTGKGGLYLLDLKDTNYSISHLTETLDLEFAPHGISLFKLKDGYKVMAINHTTEGHSIEVFHLQGKQLSHIKTLSHPTMVSPNDICIVSEHEFYFTNDHKYTEGFKKTIEDYAGLALSNVIYFDGDQYKEVANRISYANGINLDPNRDLLYVSSPRSFLVKVYKKSADGSLTFIENVHCKTGVDNIEFDRDYNLWIGCHPNLLHFSAYRAGKEEFSPSEIIKIEYKAEQDYNIDKIYVDDGQKMSGSTVAAPFGNTIIMGNLIDDHFLILRSNVQ